MQVMIAVNTIYRWLSADTCSWLMSTPCSGTSLGATALGAAGVADDGIWRDALRPDLQRTATRPIIAGPGPGALRLRHPAVHDGRNDPVVTLEDQVVEVGRRDRPQDRQLGGRLVLVEYVQRPVASGARLQVRVMSSRAVISADDDRVNPGGPLLWPGQCPDCVDPVTASSDTGGGDLPVLSSKSALISASASRACRSSSAAAAVKKRSLSCREKAPP
jgi:hypothetical protein